jgi:branched-chain amino acid transport system ATP-binding protein
VAKAGIARTFQNIRLFGEMTALENVMVGRHVRTKQNVFGAVFRHKAARDEEAAIRAKSQQLLDFVGIGQFAKRRATCPTATSAAWKSPARWRPIRNCWRWTNRRPA